MGFVLCLPLPLSSLYAKIMRVTTGHCGGCDDFDWLIVLVPAMVLLLVGLIMMLVSGIVVFCCAGKEKGEEVEDAETHAQHEADEEAALRAGKQARVHGPLDHVARHEAPRDARHAAPAHEAARWDPERR